MSKSTLRASIAAVAGILIAIGGCAENPSSAGAPTLLERGMQPSYSLAGTSSSSVIGPEGGTLRTSAGDQIVFPAGALSAPTQITISSSGQYVGVTLEPHGLTFPAGHEPVLTLSAGGAGAGFASVNVAYFDESGSLAEMLPTTATRTGDKLVANLRHFSKYYAVGT